MINKNDIGKRVLINWEIPALEWELIGMTELMAIVKNKYGTIKEFKISEVFLDTRNI